MNPQASPVATLATVLGLSFASGINLYAAVLTLGLGIRFGWFSNLPAQLDVFGHPAVIGVAAALFLAEFVADKVPFFTPFWDAIHTVIRPLGGALLAMQTTAYINPVVSALAALAGGAIALGSHSSKASFRLLAHAAPDPGTHSLISLLEDCGAVTLVALAINNPDVALPLLAVLIGLVALFSPLLFRTIRFILSGVFGRIRSWFSHAASADVPIWVTEQIKRQELPDSTAVVRCFTRSSRLMARLRDSYLLHAHDQWWLVQRRIFGTGRKMLADTGIGTASIEEGIVYDVLTLAFAAKKPQSFYLTKEWSDSARKLVAAVHPAPPPADASSAHSAAAGA
jgi:hypothetical protein